MANFKFFGSYQHNMDSKNRVAIPAKFRQSIGDEELVVTESFEGCLMVMTQSDWQRLAARKLENLDYFDSMNDRGVERMMVGVMEICSLDKQGRISLTPQLVRLAGLRKEVILMGVRDKFEIWDRKRWEAYRADFRKRMAEGR